MINFIIFILRWAITTFLWIVCWIIPYIIGYFVTWVGLLFCNKDSEHMPILWWGWDNNHGINGTLGYNNLNWVIICNPEINDLPVKKQFKQVKLLVDTKTGKERSFKNRWIWTTFRNPVTNISLYMIGLKLTKPVVSKFKEFKNIQVEKTTSGFGWFYSITIKYNSERGFYYGIGWKFTDPSENRARFIYRISPYRLLG